MLYEALGAAIKSGGPELSTAGNAGQLRTSFYSQNAQVARLNDSASPTG
jgi:hypothetical protein